MMQSNNIADVVNSTPERVNNGVSKGQGHGTGLLFEELIYLMKLMTYDTKHNFPLYCQRLRHPRDQIQHFMLQPETAAIIELLHKGISIEEELMHIIPDPNLVITGFAIDIMNAQKSKQHGIALIKDWKYECSFMLWDNEQIINLHDALGYMMGRERARDGPCTFDKIKTFAYLAIKRSGGSHGEDWIIDEGGQSGHQSIAQVVIQKKSFTFTWNIIE